MGAVGSCQWIDRQRQAWQLGNLEQLDSLYRLVKCIAAGRSVAANTMELRLKAMDPIGSIGPDLAGIDADLLGLVCRRQTFSPEGP